MAELSQQDIVFVIGIGMIGMLLLVGAIGIFISVYQRRILKEHEKQRKLDEQFAQRMIEAQLESQERERKRIAADLHDSIGSLLWGAKLNASFLERSANYQAEQQLSYRELMIALDQSIDTVKRIAWELTPQAFQQTGFSDSVSRLCNRLNRRSFDLIFTENEGILWNDDRALSAFRIMQELLSNCVKHAKAKNVSITLQWHPSTLRVVMVDDGVGLVLDKERTGVGWWNIQQRVKQLNAEIIAGPPATKIGTEIKLTIPL